MRTGTGPGANTYKSVKRYTNFVNRLIPLLPRAPLVQVHGEIRPWKPATVHDRWPQNQTR